ncbi:MAG: histidine kinase [Actinomycetota bacterium]|nr:histidine kinase [Actinomycetota bacterium]
MVPQKHGKDYAPKGETPGRFSEREPRAAEPFHYSVLDGLSAHIAVLNEAGDIVYVNEAWREFARTGGKDPEEVSEGANYLEACDSASGPYSEEADAFASGIRDVLLGRRKGFELEYPCPADEELRWFVGKVTPVPGPGPTRAVVAHEDGTGRRRYQEEREGRLAREAAGRARELEQKRIGRELHDRVAHLMVAVHQSLDLYEALLERDPKRAAEKIKLAKRVTQEAMEATRDLSLALRKTESGGGLRSALAELLQSTVPPEMAYELHAERDESSVPPNVREQFFLVVQEAVRNAVSHSGASSLRVEVGITANKIVGLVKDDGHGFDPEAAGRRDHGGLAYMKERARLLEGSCVVSSAPGKGTRTEVVLPLRTRPKSSS